MQSGISASPDLHAAFRTFLATPTQRALLVTISPTSETLIPLSTVPSTSPSLHSDLANLSPYLKPTEALYILLKTSSPPSTPPDGANNNNTAAATTTTTVPLTAISYIPDAAPVRQKTLFASTRLTLTRALGEPHFADSLFVAAADELSAQGWARHEAHGAAERPLTEDERRLRGIREAEAREGAGTARRGAGYGGGMSGRVAEGVVQALEALGRGEGGALAQLAIDVPTETVVLVAVSDASASDLARQLSPDEPRYAFYRHSLSSAADLAESAAAAAAAPVLFVYTCPTASKIKERMLYASMRGYVAGPLAEQAGLSVAKKLEATNPDEITAATIEEEFAPRQEQRSGFARPKKPGRR